MVVKQSKTTHQFSKIVDGVGEEGSYAEIVCTLKPFFRRHVRRCVNTGEKKERVFVVRRVLGPCLTRSVSESGSEDCTRFGAHLVVVSGNTVVGGIHTGLYAVEIVEHLPCAIHFLLRALDIAINEFCLCQGGQKQNMRLL